MNEHLLAGVLPAHIEWLQDVPSTRVKADLAHAKAKKTGQRTRPVSFVAADKLRKPEQAAWAELLREWMKIL